MFIKEEITDQLSLEVGLKYRFAAVDLAPNEQLETGFSALDRNRNLIRMDKLYANADIVAAVENLGPTNGSIVVIDMPKNLSIPGRWRQEEIKMHPLRLKKQSGEFTPRFESRGLKLYQTLAEKGVLVFLYFNYWTRVNYDLLIPFRSRSPQGCRALQTAIEHQLGIKNLPTNLAPSSVLESMVGAYASWSVWAGKPGKDFEVYQAETGSRVLVPTGKPHSEQQTPRRRRIHRKQLRWWHPQGSMGQNPS